MSELVFQFGRQLYHAENPPATWRQSGPKAPVYCIRCNEDLVWTFPARLDPVAAGQAGGYSTPCAVRCNCFLKVPQGHHSGELLESPIKVTSIQSAEKS
jgi:hypothetical protein